MNITICTSLEEAQLNSLKKLKSYSFLNEAKIQLIHCFEIHYYSSELTPFIYPAEDQKDEIKTSVIKVLENLAVDIGLSKNQVSIECLFDESPKEKVVSYLKQKNSDLVVAATRGKHGIEGIFTSSFADHLNRYSPCDVLIVRPENK